MKGNEEARLQIGKVQRTPSPQQNIEIFQNDITISYPRVPHFPLWNY